MKKIYVGRKLDGSYGLNPLGRENLTGLQVQSYANLESLVGGVEEVSKKRNLIVEISSRCNEGGAFEIRRKILAGNMKHIKDIVYRGRSLLEKEGLVA